MFIKVVKKNIWKIRLLKEKGILGNLKVLKSTEWLDKNELKKLQQKKLENLLSYAHKNVPYYNKLLEDFQIVTKSGEIKLQDFSKIPLLDKSIIKINFQELKSDEIDQQGWYKNTSGGSTGEPAVFLQNQEYKAWNSAVPILFDEWTGLDLGEKKVILWGSEKDLLKVGKNYKRKLGAWFRNELTLNSYEMEDSQMEVHVSKINTFKPVQIVSYAESIYELSLFIEKNKIRVHSPRAIITTAGTLFPNMREVIERVFNAPVFNRYGSREVGGIACECSSHEGLHISPLTQYIEILDENGTHAKVGEVGEIVVTSLTNFAMPLIRYKIGDMGIWAEKNCSCGRSYPLLKEVTGRTTDMFVTIEGNKIHPGYFRRLFYYKDWVVKYQIIQEDFQFIRIVIVKSENIDINIWKKDLDEITLEISKVMGQECKVSFEYVNEISSTSSGKYRYTICKIDSNNIKDK